MTEFSIKVRWEVKDDFTPEFEKKFGPSPWFQTWWFSRPEVKSKKDFSKFPTRPRYRKFTLNKEFGIRLGRLSLILGRHQVRYELQQLSVVS